MTKERLFQYMETKKEAEEVRSKIWRLSSQIAQLERGIEKMEQAKETVRDKVFGGYGGTQGFSIEGFASREYERKRTRAMAKKLMLGMRKDRLDELEERLDREVIEIESFIAGIGDSHIRRIINLRVVEGMTWDSVAAKIGGGNTEDSVRKALCRFLASCPKSPPEA